jgi:hypothetical protein
MSTNELIDAYVTDVALRLPRRQRNDVACELRALLDEELAARAQAQGQAVDATTAMALLQSFGHPDEVAARYLPTWTVIEPAQGRAFLRLAVIGLAVIWIGGLVDAFERSPGSLLAAIVHWWGHVVLPSPWWPGVLVIGFALSAWSRRRWPSSTPWTPRSAEPTAGRRVALAFGVLGIIAGLGILAEPRVVLDVIWGGRAAPSAYQALTYTERFRATFAPAIFVLLSLNIPLLVATIANVRRTPTLRALDIGHGVVTSAVIAWAVIDGPVMMTPESDAVARAGMLLGAAVGFVALALERWRRVTPAPTSHGAGGMP